jgi:uncharacterized repeat protein (TIGR03803 family)
LFLGGTAKASCGELDADNLTATPATGTLVHSFNCGTDGGKPQAGLVDVNGTLYGTTTNAGSAGYGTIYSFVPATGKFSSLYSFSSLDGTHAMAPLLNVNGVLYGTAMSGGKSHAGTIFKFSP